jgi:hypothetical protein
MLTFLTVIGSTNTVVAMNNEFSQSTPSEFIDASVSTQQSFPDHEVESQGNINGVQLDDSSLEYHPTILILVRSTEEGNEFFKSSLEYGNFRVRYGDGSTQELDPRKADPGSNFDKGYLYSHLKNLPIKDVQYYAVMPKLNHHYRIFGTTPEQVKDGEIFCIRKFQVFDID